MDTRPLVKPRRTQRALYHSKVPCAIRVELVLEASFAKDDVGANRTTDKIPSVVANQSIIFFFHGMMPGRVDEGGTDGSGHRREK
jgi:hypothetical protein